MCVNTDICYQDRSVTVIWITVVKKVTLSGKKYKYRQIFYINKFRQFFNTTRIESKLLDAISHINLLQCQVLIYLPDTYINFLSRWFMIGL